MYDKLNSVCFLCNMDFSLVCEPPPRRNRLEWDSETRVEKIPSHMETHTQCISSNMISFDREVTGNAAILARVCITSLDPQWHIITPYCDCICRFDAILTIMNMKLK